MASRLLPRATLSTAYGSACGACCRPTAASTAPLRLQQPVCRACQPRCAAAAGRQVGLGISGPLPPATPKRGAIMPAAAGAVPLLLPNSRRSTAF